MADEVSDPGLTSEQRAAIAVHNATQNRMCLNLSGNGQICVACSEVADQIDAAVEVERQRSQAALAAARRECAKKDAALNRCHDLFSTIRGDWTDPRSECREGMAIARAALAAPAAGEEGKHD